MSSIRKSRRARHKPKPAPKFLRPIVAASLDLFPHSLNHQVLLTVDEALEYCVAMESSPERYDVPMLKLVKELNKIVPRCERVGIHHKFKLGESIAQSFTCGYLKFTYQIMTGMPSFYN